MYEREISGEIFELKLFAGCRIVLFEDGDTAADLFPFTVMRPSWEIRSGVGCLRHWLEQLDLAGLYSVPRMPSDPNDDSLQVIREDQSSRGAECDTIFVNGRLISIRRESSGKAAPLPDVVRDKRGRILIARCKGLSADELRGIAGTDIPHKFVQKRGEATLPVAGWRILYAAYPWDYMTVNREILEMQLAVLGPRSQQQEAKNNPDSISGSPSFTDIKSGYPVVLGFDVILRPQVVFGNHAGAIWIESGTEIEPHTYLEGPLYIGPGCRIKAGARISGGTSLGPSCRVAGEITGSILQGYVNKQHSGFLGSSHLGEWVNLGAGTNNSNLRNDYGPVKVQVGGKLVDTGRRFVGLMAGDHVKTGINTMLNTGTIIGVGANVYGGGFPPRFIPSFSWGGAEGLKPGPFERILEAARVAMERRGLELTADQEQMLRQHYEGTVREETGN